MITGLLARQLRISVLRFYAENDLSKIQPIKDVKQKPVQDTPVLPLAALKKYNPGEFNVIPETNVFAESRSKEEKVEVAAPPEPPPLAQKPILVGVTIVDNLKKASIIDPTNPSHESGRRAQIKRIGDVYHGYTITEITAGNIVLESGTRREVIPLHEGSKKTQVGKTPILSTRVVSFGGGGTSGGSPVSAASGVAGRTSVTPVGSSPSGAQSGSSTTATSRSPASAPPRGSTSETPPPAARQSQQRTTNTETDSQGRRVIRTPFGTITRPNRE